MIQFDFAGVRIGLQRNHETPELALPEGFRPVKSEDTPDIRLELSVGNSSLPEPVGEPQLRRGRMEAYGGPEHLLWWHPDLGTIIDAYPREGRVEIALSASAWVQADHLFDQLVLPALLPPLAARGVRGLHASAVDIDGRTVLIAGHSGSGKTTSALLLLSQGARLVADDMVFLYRENGAYRVAGLGDGMRASDKVWSRFGHFQPGPPDHAGKRRLINDRVPWIRQSRVTGCLLLGFPNMKGHLDDMRALPALMSLVYHAGDEKQALAALRAFAESVQIVAVSGSDEAATLALNLLRGRSAQ